MFIVFHEEQDVYRIEITYVPTLQSTEGVSGQKSGPESGPETTQKTTQRILEQMKANPYVSREELAEICGLTSDGIKYNIRKLREKGIIKRIGPDKGGHWEVIEE